MNGQVNTSRDEIIKLIDKVPGFNATVAKVVQLVNDPNSQPKDLLHAISLDPVLTGNILKLINSAYFGVATKVVSVNRAVVMLGFNTIKNLALSSSLVSNIKMRNDFQWFTSDQFWEHSLGVAVGSKMLATRIGVVVAEREEYFIAGLLHDMGKVIFVQYLPQEYAQILNPEYRPGEPRSVVEAEEFGIDHAELGQLMTEKWKLPPILPNSISEHHTPIFLGDSFDKIKACVHISNIFCNRMKIGIDKPGVLEAPETEALQVLSLKEEDVIEVFSNLEEKVDEAKVFLQR